MMPLLFKALGFVLRLVVFAVTGEWFAPPETEAEASGPARLPAKPSDEVAAAAPPRKAARAPGPGPETVRTPPAAALADVGTCLASLAEPILQHARAHGLGLPALQFVAGADREAEQGCEPVPEEPRVIIDVEPGIADTPERWVLLARQVGRGLFDRWPGWSTELYTAHQLSSSLFLPPGHGVYDANTARQAVGVWLPELFADVFGAYVLGPGYVSSLCATLSRPQQPIQTLLAGATGRFMSAVPPAHVRVYVTLATLTRLGFHEWERTLSARWDAAHGVADVLYLPLSDGRLMSVPLAFMLAEVDDVLTTLLDEPQAALGDVAWLTVPGLAYLHGEHAEAETAAAALARGEAIDLSTRCLVAGAALALDTQPSRRAVVAKALVRSIRGAGTLEAAPNAYNRVAAAHHVGAAPSLATAFRDPRSVREALIVASAIARRGGRNLRP